MASNITVKILGDAKGLTGALSEAGGKLGEFGKIAGGALLAAGGIAAGALTKGFIDALDAAGVDRQIAASLGVDAKTAEHYGDLAASVYRDAWGDSLADVAESVGAVTQQLGELDDQGIKDATVAAQAMTDVFGIEATEAINHVGILLGSGLVDSAEEGFDVLTAAMQHVPQALQGDLLDASDEYGQFFNALGLNAEESFGLLVSASKDGMFGIDKTGDALKELTIRSTDMSTSSVAAYEAAGLSAEDMSARFLVGGDTARGALDDLVTGLQGIEDPTARANAAIALFGTPLEDLGVDQIPDFLDSLSAMPDVLGDVSGSAQEMADTIGADPMATIESFKREALGKLADFVGNTLIPKFTQGVEWFKLHWPEIQATLLQVWQSVQQAWLTYGQPVLEAVISFGQRVVEWVRTNWPQIQATITEVMDGIRNVIQTVLDVIQAVWDAHGAQVIAVLQAAWEYISTLVESAIQVVRGIIDAVLAIIRGDWGDAWAAIKQIVSGVWDAIVAYTKYILEVLKLAIQLAWDAIKLAVGAVWGWIKREISEAWEGIKSSVSGALDSIKGWLAGAWDTIKGAVAEAWNTVKTTITDAIGDVLSAIGSLPGKIGELVPRMLDAGKSMGRGFLNGVVNAIKGAVDVAKDIAGGIIAAFKSAWNSAAQYINDLIPDKISLPFAPDINLPDNPLPTFHQGGIVPGRIGDEVLILAQAGEEVIPIDRAGSGRGGPLVGTLIVQDGRSIHQELALVDALYGQGGMAA